MLQGHVSGVLLCHAVMHLLTVSKSLFAQLALPCPKHTGPNLFHTEEASSGHALHFVHATCAYTMFSLVSCWVLARLHKDLLTCHVLLCRMCMHSHAVLGKPGCMSSPANHHQSSTSSNLSRVCSFQCTKNKARAAIDQGCCTGCNFLLSIQKQALHGLL